MTPEDDRLVSQVPKRMLAVNGIPESGAMSKRQRAASIAHHVLDDLLLPGGMPLSPMGAGWARDLDLHVRKIPDPTRLENSGWLPLDGLLRRLGYSGSNRWAVTDREEILTVADIKLEPPPDPLEAIIFRCHRRGEVRLREVLELRALVREGRRLPSSEPVITLAASIEAWLGGDLLSEWVAGSPSRPPLRLPKGRLRHAVTSAIPSTRPRVTVAISGVDGAGKSTVSQAVETQLRLAGIPATLVWTRPGMRLGLLRKVSRVAKRLLGHELVPSVRLAAKGGKNAALPFRRGGLGWMWTLLVTCSFLIDIRRRHLASRGVVIYDRHLLDALVTLDFLYRGVDTRVHKILVRRFLPKAFITFYLKVSATVAIGRKPMDFFDEAGIRSQLDLYQLHRSEVEGVHDLDGTAPVSEMTFSILQRLFCKAGDSTDARDLR